MPLKILISAGEASGDLYAAQLVRELRRRDPEAEFFGCAGHRMQKEGVRPVVDAASLAVVGLVEVVTHIPRIYREFRKLVRSARYEQPDLAILTDSPDFHLRLAAKLKKFGIPVVYLVAPQAWAWRKGRIPAMRRNIDRLLCIFPFEEPFFQRHGVAAEYIGYPLARVVKPSLSKDAFFRKHRIGFERPVVVLLPGSRYGETVRHLPPLLEAVDRIYARQAATFLLALPAERRLEGLPEELRDAIQRRPVQVLQGETWDALAHSDLALCASGTVTMEAALLGTPMVTFYRVTRLSWWMGRFLVNVPFYTMVNLVAGKAVVPELMQVEMTGERVAAEALRLLGNEEARNTMRRELGEVAEKLRTAGDPMEHAADIVMTVQTEATGQGVRI